jgi:hypothetical protein
MFLLGRGERAGLGLPQPRQATRYIRLADMHNSKKQFLTWKDDSHSIKKFPVLIDPKGSLQSSQKLITVPPYPEPNQLQSTPSIFTTYPIYAQVFQIISSMFADQIPVRMKGELESHETQPPPLWRTGVL